MVVEAKPEQEKISFSLLWCGVVAEKERRREEYETSCFQSWTILSCDQLRAHVLFFYSFFNLDTAHRLPLRHSPPTIRNRGGAPLPSVAPETKGR
jgi:hypothetical protein